MKKLLALFLVTTLVSTCALSGIALSGSSSVSDDETKYSYYENGQKKWEENYKDGKLDGKYTAWDENGQKKWEENYKDGKQDGKSTMWYEDGEGIQEENYKEGKLDGKLTYWDENNQILIELNFKDDVCISGDIEWCEFFTPSRPLYP